MRRSLLSVGVSSVVVLALASCGEEAPADEWLGPQLHLKVEGFISGKTLDFYSEGETNATLFRCERRYEVPDPMDDTTWKDGILAEFSVKLRNELADEAIPGTRKINFEFQYHDFQRDTLPSTVSVTPRIDDLKKPTPDQVWLECQLNDDNNVQYYEQTAQSGTATVNIYTGEPGPDGLVIEDNETTVGGTFDARWSTTEHLKGSFSVVCSQHRVYKM